MKFVTVEEAQANAEWRSPVSSRKNAIGSSMRIECDTSPCRITSDV